MEMTIEFDKQALGSANSPQILNVLSIYSGIPRSVRQEIAKRADVIVLRPFTKLL